MTLTKSLMVMPRCDRVVVLLKLELLTRLYKLGYSSRTPQDENRSLLSCGVKGKSPAKQAICLTGF
ncbi:MAG: hypothetical protein ACK5VA_07535 [Pseudanabaena sp.]|nr:hypothetical protein [Pseudanabaena sp. M090S1SP2A07QC]MCA6507809.1 hypothetical protein [Pseudanabaena sp. M172S2SP2A07QC]MCA6509101.1 hypothetical protein [Pseudanabaena sp. M109S1SP2A07QC]MCA6524843.1 hypothetical protein [Pseudanabaena sp. M179S2SP2A07QC]MCA6535043.1 hypothetical protein [Pseudanabaena sp. M176S2SP2A07QC]MCA6537830.1 hypothetical protein [Pseudanabaena sp. M037S2SP2A07QC]MCA6559279.1 hypothetical protein [Pseudanabaena sp. M079S1SP2A07QC]MCA6565985.1 hypothetical prot